MKDDSLDDAAAAGPSKTQRKHEMHELQKLGEALSRLSPEQLRRIDLPDALREALLFATKVGSHEGGRRHRQYIGKLMRQVDAEPIRRALQDATGDSRAAVDLMHRAEQWRERLLDDDGALTELLAQYPTAEVQALRATIRAARRERASGTPPRHARQLYSSLHALLKPVAPPA